MMVDLCSHGWEAQPGDDSHCVTRAHWRLPVNGETWLVASGPLQVGGLAHSAPQPQDHGWGATPTAHGFHGCLSHLTVNNQVTSISILWVSGMRCIPIPL